MSVLLIGGHMRSGTSLLNRLCDAHPDIRTTNELQCFQVPPVCFARYARRLIPRLWNNPYVTYQQPSLFVPRDGRPRIFFRNLAFLSGFLGHIARQQGHQRQSVVTLPVIEAALRAMLPPARLVGDKFPDYVHRLDSWSGSDAIRLVIIYRDGRDVVSSTLKNVRTVWAGQKWTQTINTADAVARQWVQAIAVMERNARHGHLIRYEELVRQPHTVLADLGRWLGVDPAGFPARRVRDSSVGKHAESLSREELSVVMRIAGSTLERLGYA